MKQNKSNQNKTNQIKSNQIKSNQIFKYTNIAKKALVSCEKLTTIHSHEYILTVTTLGEVLMHAGRFNESFEYLSKALQYAESFHGEHPLIGKLVMFYIFYFLF